MITCLNVECPDPSSLNDSCWTQVYPLYNISSCPALKKLFDNKKTPTNNMVRPFYRQDIPYEQLYSISSNRQRCCQMIDGSSSEEFSCFSIETTKHFILTLIVATGRWRSQVVGYSPDPSGRFLRIWYLSFPDEAVQGLLQSWNLQVVQDLGQKGSLDWTSYGWFLLCQCLGW